MNRIRNFFSTFSRKPQKLFFENTFMTKWDYLAMGVLTLFFTILVFYRIGNTSAPQSAYTATSEDRDIVIDLGDYVDVGSIHMFLGNLNTRKFSISAFNEVTGAWEVLQGETAAESVFAWNTIAINYNLRYLGIVALDEECVINELVLTSPDGTILSPIYDAKYSALFDEQDLFPAVKTYLTGTMFDEVYHGRTAYEFIHGLVTYETTHPQLGKILISLGIRMFGMTPFGWRFMSALFGIFMVPLFYLFAKRLFQNSFAATATTILLVFDCMHFMLSRIATIDIFVAFFIILAYYYLYRYFPCCRPSGAVRYRYVSCHCHEINRCLCSCRTCHPFYLVHNPAFSEAADSPAVFILYRLFRDTSTCSVYTCLYSCCRCRRLQRTD